MYSYGYFIYYALGIVLLPAIFLAVMAEAKVESNYRKYKSVLAKSGSTAYEVARRILDYHGLNDIQIVEIKGKLTDNYNHRKKTISLSSDVYNSTSVSAISVACHEVGHAIQYKNHYFPIKLRNLIIPMCNIASKLLIPLVILGVVLDFVLLIPNVGRIILIIGVASYGLTTLFNLITLPVEYNASNRAHKLMLELGELDEEEIVGAKAVLSSAALTYLASFVYSLLNLLRFVGTIFIVIHSQK